MVLTAARRKEKSEPLSKTTVNYFYIENISRSVMILPKIDYLMADDIYIGALITLRKKNAYPLIFTDVTGNIVGWNNLASKLISDKGPLNEGSLFAIYPRLFLAYYPEMHDVLLGPKDSVNNANEENDAITMLDDSSSENEATKVAQTIADFKNVLNKNFDAFQFFYGGYGVRGASLFAGLWRDRAARS